MAARLDNLRESTDRSVRLVALGHLADAVAAQERLASASDDEALHDFRVALRRLRSWERAFRPYLKADVGKRLRRRLRNLARDTGASRDLEVHLGWLADQRRSLGRRQRAGLKWLVGAFEARKTEADAVLEDDVDDRFTKLETKLRRALTTYRESVHLRSDGRAARVRSFGDALAPRVRGAAKDLQDQLARVHTVHDEHEGHEARIAAKRTRYLLEPVAKIVPGAAGIVERLKALQDVLGDLHDAQVFGAEIAALAAEQAADEPTDKRTNRARKSANRSAATTPNAVATPGTPAGPASADTATPAPSPAPIPAGTTAVVPVSTAIPPVDSAAAAPATATASPPAASASASPTPPPDIAPGIAAIRERLADRATAAFSRFSTEWLGENSVSFFRDLDAVVERIADAASDGLEIERKYLLRFVPDEARDGRRIDIAQGYVPGSRLHERIRRVSIAHGSGRKEIHFYRTVKVGEGVVRTEIEEETTESIFLAMWPLTKRRRLRKRRFEIEADGRTWEIDEFKNRDLVLAEIELDSEDDDVVFPDWLAPAVQREVTGEPEFQNINLAR